MSTVPLTDNTKNHAARLTQRDFENLWTVANRTIEDLVVENHNFLVYPPALKDSKDKIGDSSIFSIAEHEWGGNSNGCRISTGNLMGFFRCGSGREQTEVNIQSRFVPAKKNESGEDWFLPYMLSKVLNFNILNNETSKKQDALFDLLVLLFPRYLVDACQKGLFRQYVVHNYNDSRVRGGVDVSRHIRHNVPFSGRIAYRTREYSSDNAVTQLIRHTVEFIRRHKYATILNASEVAGYVSQICEATSSYSPNERRKILDQNRRDVSHPYLSEYTDLQKLCRMILMFDESNYGIAQDEVISGVLFDGAWLWEEYLNVVLEEAGVGLTHAKNKSGGGAIHPIVDQNGKDIGLFYPDFYRKSPGFVIDAKYKRLENKNPQADDLQQVIAYMHILSAKSGVYLYPRETPQNFNECYLGTLNGMGGKLYTYGLFIPTDCCDFSTFKQSMQTQELALVDFVKKVSTP